MLAADRLSQANVDMHIRQLGEDYDTSRDDDSVRTSSIPVQFRGLRAKPKPPPDPDVSKKAETEEQRNNDRAGLEGFQKSIYDQQAAQVDYVSEIKNDTLNNVDWWGHGRQRASAKQVHQNKNFCGFMSSFGE